MLEINKNTKRIRMRRGDTGNIHINGFPNDGITYTAYLAVNEGTRIMQEWHATVVNGSATLLVTKETSDVIPEGNYTYAVKNCYTNTDNMECEDTLLPKLDSEAPEFIVLDKLVEGT